MSNEDKEREAFEAWYIAKARKNIPALTKWNDQEVRGSFLPRHEDGHQYAGDYVVGSWDAFQAGRASLAASAGSEPVAWCQPDDPHAGAAFSWPGRDKLPHHTTPLYTHPSPPEGMVGGWRPLTESERDHFVGELIDYGTGFVTPLYSVVEGIEKLLRTRNAPPIAAGGGKDADRGM